MAKEEKPTFEPPKMVDEGSAEEDFVFRFRLELPEPDESGYADPLLELIRGQLADLLDAVVLTDHGRRVRVDGFRLLQDPEMQYEIFPQKPGTGQP